LSYIIYMYELTYQYDKFCTRLSINICLGLILHVLGILVNKSIRWREKYLRRKSVKSSSGNIELWPEVKNRVFESWVWLSFESWMSFKIGNEYMNFKSCYTTQNSENWKLDVAAPKIWYSDVEVMWQVKDVSQ
jgi:hypothetical protein